MLVSPRVSVVVLGAWLHTCIAYVSVGGYCKGHVSLLKDTSTHTPKDAKGSMKLRLRPLNFAGSMGAREGWTLLGMAASGERGQGGVEKRGSGAGGEVRKFSSFSSSRSFSPESGGGKEAGRGRELSAGLRGGGEERAEREGRSAPGAERARGAGEKMRAGVDERVVKPLINEDGKAEPNGKGETTSSERTSASRATAARTSSTTRSHMYMNIHHTHTHTHTHTHNVCVCVCD